MGNILVKENKFTEAYYARTEITKAVNLGNYVTFEKMLLATPEQKPKSPDISNKNEEENELLALLEVQNSLTKWQSIGKTGLI